MQAHPAERVDRAAIGQITHNGMTHLGKVRSNLILSARLERYFH